MARRQIPLDVMLWALHYDVSVRRGEMSLALEMSICALFYAAILSFLSASSKPYTSYTVDPNSHKLFSRIVDFSQRLSNKSAGEGGAAASEEVISDFS